MYDMRYPQYGNYNNPYSYRLQQYQQPKPYDALVRVTGIDGARAYPMPPSSSAVLFDSNSDTMYIKTTDSGGFPSIRCFDFTQHTEKAKDEPLWATKQDLENLRKELMQNGQQFIRKQQKQQNAEGK